MKIASRHRKYHMYASTKPMPGQAAGQVITHTQKKYNNLNTKGRGNAASVFHMVVAR